MLADCHFQLMWCAGVHPPGKLSELGSVIKVVYHLMCGHRAAAAAIQAASAALQHSPTILIANNVICFEPLNKWNPFLRRRSALDMIVIA